MVPLYFVLHSRLPSPCTAARAGAALLASPPLLANREFWQYLSREHGADLIVSGVVTYGRADVSGFRDVDVVSSRTGQKVREMRFVEQEEFSYGDVDFFDVALLAFRIVEDDGDDSDGPGRQ